MADDPPFHNPFGVLGALKARLPQPPAAAAPPPPAATGKSDTSRPSFPRAVVRLERSGRGGKEVTVIDHLTLSAKDRDLWLKALKAALGCGGVVEGDTIVLQGDHRKRLPALLASRGVKKVTIG